MSAQAIPTPKAAAKAPTYAWVILAVVYLASVAAPLNQFKVPPVMPLLIQAFNLSLGSAGILMSIFSITGFLLALPAGFILQRFGPKITGLIAVGAVVVGSVLGALSNTSALMLASRFIEGAGMGLIMVVAPAAIAMWFPAETRGTPMGLWATCVGIGGIIMYNLAPALAALFSWRAVWWAGAAFALVAFVLFGALFRMPKQEEAAGGRSSGKAEAGREKPPSLGKAIANRSLWLLSLEFLCFNVVVLAFSTYYPTFLNGVRNYTLAGASFMASLATIFAILATPLGGYMSDRIGSRKLLIVIPFILTALTFLFPFSVTGWMIPGLMIVMGTLTGPVAPATFATVPEVMVLPQLAGYGMAVLALGQNLGMFIGPVMFGQLVESMGWTAAGYLMIPVCAIGIIAGWLVKVR